MSLILDALRKSEAERRRGQAPDLFASLPAPSAPRAGGLSRLWPALLLGGLVLGAGFVFWHGRAAAPATDPDVGAEASPASDPDAPLPTVVVSAPAPAARALAVSRDPPSAALPPPAASASAAPGRPAAAPGSVPAASAAVTTATPARPPAPPRPAPTVASAAPPTAVLPAPLVPAASAASASATATATAADSSEDLPPIAILAASERAALPALKLSMHVWNSEPGKRFAIIDGHRVTEGSSAGGSIIEEIRRDGVVLNVNGRRVLLPRP